MTSYRDSLGFLLLRSRCAQGFRNILRTTAVREHSATIDFLLKFEINSYLLIARTTRVDVKSD